MPLKSSNCEGLVGTIYISTMSPKESLTPKKVIFNPPATIVFWPGGSKTVVKCENEIFDWEKGLAMAICKKALGNRGNYYNIFKAHEEQGKRVSYDNLTECYLEQVNKGIDTVSTRNIAAEIVEIFESLLQRYDIWITTENPEDDRRKRCLSLYGDVYYNFLDEVENEVYDFLNDVANRRYPITGFITENIIDRFIRILKEHDITELILASNSKDRATISTCISDCLKAAEKVVLDGGVTIKKGVLY